VAHHAENRLGADEGDVQECAEPKPQAEIGGRMMVSVSMMSPMSMIVSMIVSMVMVMSMIMAARSIAACMRMAVIVAVCVGVRLMRVVMTVIPAMLMT